MINLKAMNKAERKRHAVRHVDNMNNAYQNEIGMSIEYTKLYIRETPFLENSSDFQKKYKTKVYFSSNDTLTELFQIPVPAQLRTAILNFASYKNPGGMFYEGSDAQEEFLCHHSTLYPVLNTFKPTYYDSHKETLNYSLYTDTGLYSADIEFFDYQLVTPSNGQVVSYDNLYTVGDVALADVITCAAPNVRAFMRYQRDRNRFKNLSDEEIEKMIYRTIYKRCEFVLEMARVNNVATLILGAFGCGVFGCDPAMVAEIFASLIYGKYYGVFMEVRFPIPYGNKNHEEFRDHFIVNHFISTMGANGIDNTIEARRKNK